MKVGASPRRGAEMDEVMSTHTGEPGGGEEGGVDGGGVGVPPPQFVVHPLKTLGGLEGTGVVPHPACE